MELIYKFHYEIPFLRDIGKLRKDISKEKFINLMKLFKNKKLLLTQFPRIYQKVEFNNLQNGEYRRIVLDQYIVIYKIVSNKISFLKIYPQKTNYINQIEKFR